MTSSPFRVIQWATGNTGQRALREVIRHPALELVGVRVYDEAKNGVDAGELCGESSTGVLASTDRDAVLGIKADCCVYMPRATGPQHTRSGLTEDQVIDDAVALLESGTNIVTTISDFFARGSRLSPANRERVEDACKRGNSSVWASGGDPGFILETVPLALLSIQRRVDLVEIIEYGDVSRRPSKHMIREQMRFGKPLAQFDADNRRDRLFYTYKTPLTVLADIAGFEIDEWVAECEGAAAKDDLQIVTGEIKKGTAAAHKLVIRGRSGGVDRVRFIQYGFVTLDVDPDWGLEPSGWRVRIEGDAPVDARMPFPVTLDELPDHVPAYNGNGLVNAIPYMSSAPTGLLTTEDMPHISPRGPRNRA